MQEIITNVYYHICYECYIWLYLDRTFIRKKVSLQTSISTSIDSNTLTLSQVAEYLNMTEEEVRGIIEDMIQQKDGYFSKKITSCCTHFVRCLNSKIWRIDLNMGGLN